jgi:hypothetical protein
MEYYPTSKRNDVLKHATKWVSHETSEVREARNKRPHILYNPNYKKYLK